jgi:8-oxo-dGTP diphosphatase
VIDLLWRFGLRLAYALVRLHYALLHPRVRGALVVLRHGGEVLVLRNSYRRAWSLPGGGVRRGEAGREAARRELREEIGLQAAAAQLRPLRPVDLEWEGKRDHVELFELPVEARPAVAIDRREVVEARFLPIAEALALELIPPARCALEQLAETAAPAPR